MSEAPVSWTDIWQPQSKRQQAFVSCPAPEIFLGGPRAAGKTDALIAHWMKHADDYGEHAVGCLFYRSYKMIAPTNARMQSLFPKLGGQYDRESATWSFPNEASLKLRHLWDFEDTFVFSGHQYSWLGFDNAESWDNPDAVMRMMACLKRPTRKVRNQFIVVGDDSDDTPRWIKDRYTSHGAYKLVLDPDTLGTRVYIDGSL